MHVHTQQDPAYNTKGTKYRITSKFILPGRSKFPLLPEDSEPGYKGGPIHILSDGPHRTGYGYKVQSSAPVRSMQGGDEGNFGNQAAMQV